MTRSNTPMLKIEMPVCLNTHALPMPSITGVLCMKKEFSEGEDYVLFEWSRKHSSTAKVCDEENHPYFMDPPTTLFFSAVPHLIAPLPPPSSMFWHPLPPFILFIFV